MNQSLLVMLEKVTEPHEFHLVHWRVGVDGTGGIESEVEAVGRESGSDIGVFGRCHDQNLDIDQHLGLGLVVDPDELLGDRHLVRSIAEGDRVELLVGGEPARLDQRPQQLVNLLDVGVGKERRS